MNRKWLAVSALTVSLVALSACGDKNNNDLGMNARNNGTRNNGNLGMNAGNNGTQNVRYGSSGLNNGGNPTGNTTRNTNVTQNTNRSNTTQVRYGWQNVQKMNGSDQAIANRATKIAASVDHVKKANVIVGGKTIYAALRVDDNVNDRNVTANVRRVLKQNYPNMNVNVVSDTGAFDQMGNVLNGRTGATGRNVGNNLNGVNGRNNRNNGNDFPNTSDNAPINTLR